VCVWGGGEWNVGSGVVGGWGKKRRREDKEEKTLLSISCPINNLNAAALEHHRHLQPLSVQRRHPSLPPPGAGSREGQGRKGEGDGGGAAEEPAGARGGQAERGGRASGAALAGAGCVCGGGRGSVGAGPEVGKVGVRLGVVQVW